MRHPFEEILAEQMDDSQALRDLSVSAPHPSVQSRRSMIRCISTGFVSAAMLLVGRRVMAQDARGSLSLETLPGPTPNRSPEGEVPTLAYGEEGAARPRAQTGNDVDPRRQRRRSDDAADPDGDRYTTQALGEEGGRREVPRQDRGEDDVTTQALGEEGAGRRRNPDDGRYTTQALGEEGGRDDRWRDDRQRERYTTQALGEEGGQPDRGDGTYTTQALGEEGGRNGWDRGDGRYTTQALGEEGGGRYTTQALGEEGGRWPDERQRYTTQALGEEGSAPPPRRWRVPTNDPPQQRPRLRERLRNWTGRLLGR